MNDFKWKELKPQLSNNGTHQGNRKGIWTRRVPSSGFDSPAAPQGAERAQTADARPGPRRPLTEEEEDREKWKGRGREVAPVSPQAAITPGPRPVCLPVLQAPRPVHVRPAMLEPASPRRCSPLAPARLPGPDPSLCPAAASAAEGRKRWVS
ncbi:hypothetical protein H8959_019766 [Pygathrix nigripes]